ncbi:helix-turn-helix domain-containing protein [Actinomyces ruminicola]|uniref:helix-turn-helix domain-containing protein n=1 Tax=Actinomyces ruminicola TaxID=332524 RepID=UPI001C40AB38|nr:helix-turn-helix domain-containing protein [Actinomyces ruminicola]
MAALASIAEHGEVTIGRVPDELTSTVAADMLGVSRPTLLKWSRDGVIDSFKVGTHTRFCREDVVRLRYERERERRRAFEELRALDAEGTVSI